MPLYSTFFSLIKRNLTVNIQTEDVNKTRKTVIVTISADELAAEEKALLGQFGQQAKIPGFRPGKAPVNLVKSRYAKELREELNRKMVSEAYQQISKEDGIKLYGIVDIQGAEIEDTKSEANITFTIDVQPEFELPQYKGLEIHKHPVEVEDEDVQQVIDRMLAQRADYNPVERAAEKGDYVKVSYEGKIGDEAVADLVPENPIYGKQPVTWEEAGNEDSPGVQAVVQGIIGMAKDDKKTVEETFPEDFNIEALAGKTVSYEVEVQEVRERVMPPIDEDFLKTMQAESEEQLRENIKSRIQQQKEQDNDEHMRQQILGQLSEKLDFELPESAIERETNTLLQQHMQHYMQQGIQPEQFEEHKDQLISGARDAATKHVKSEFILSKIAEKEDIEIKDQDLQQRILQEAYMSGTRPDELVKQLQQDRGRVEMLRRSVLVNKTLEFLVSSANVSVQEHCDHDHDHDHDHEK